MQVVHYELAELRKAMGSYGRTMESYGIAMVKLWQSYGRAMVELWSTVQMISFAMDTTATTGYNRYYSSPTEALL